MSSLDEYARYRQPVEGSERPPEPTRPTPQHPKGFEPGVRWDGAEGEVVSRPLEEPNPNWDTILESWGFDPEVFEVLEPVTVKTWDGWAKGPDGNIISKQLWSYKANIRTRQNTSHRVDVDELIAEIKKHRPRKSEPPTGDQAFVACLSDWQMGVGKGGGYEGPGSEAIVQRVLESADSVQRRYRELRRLGRPLGSLYVLGLGDLLEGCDEFYAQQRFQADLDNRDQMKVVRRLIRDLIARWSKDFEQVVVSAVGGNHGEARKDGKSHTTFNDNTDVAVFEQVAEIFAANPETYGHVSFVLPTDQLALVLDICGTRVGFTHGHLARRGSGALDRLTRWWSGQAFGGHAVGDAQVLIVGHLHHLMLCQQGGRTLIQAPALDNGSAWFTDTTGLWSPSGTLTFTAGQGSWSDLMVV